MSLISPQLNRFFGIKHYLLGTVLLPLSKRALFFHMGKQLPLRKWHQNGAPKGPVLRTAKRLPKGAVLVPLIFLSVLDDLYSLEFLVARGIFHNSVDFMIGRVVSYHQGMQNVY